MDKMSDTTLDSKGLIRNDTGQLLKTITNLVLCFNIDENLKGLFHFNEFSGCIEYAQDAIWHGIKRGKRLDDDDIIFLQYYLAHNKRFEMTVEKIRNAIIEISRRSIYHPVRFYLSQLEWDHVERLDYWLIKGCGVEDNIYTREVGRKWLTAAVARVYVPGIKFDHVLVLEGKENIGKSSALRVLGDPWFTDSVSLLQKEPDIVAKMTGNWIIELSEMHSVKMQVADFIKSFLSCQSDQQRLTYRRDPQKFPRQSIFAGTSNSMSYLLDKDGNRRFWPVECSKIDIQWLKENRDQLFAEAKYRFNNQEKLYLQDNVYEMAKKFQKMRLGGDEVLEYEIERYLIGKDETTLNEILIKCLQHSLKDSNLSSQQMIVGRILIRLGFEKKRRNAADGSRYKYIRENVITQDQIQEEEY